MGAGAPAPPIRPAMTHEPNGTGQRGQWISGQTDETAFRTVQRQRFARLHSRPCVAVRRRGRPRRRGRILFADEIPAVVKTRSALMAACRSDDRIAATSSSTTAIVADDPPLACSSAASIGRLSHGSGRGARHSPGREARDRLDSR